MRANGGAGHALPVLGRLGRDAAGSAAPGLGYEKGAEARGCPEGALSGAQSFMLAKSSALSRQVARSLSNMRSARTVCRSANDETRARGILVEKQ